MLKLIGNSSLISVLSTLAPMPFNRRSAYARGILFCPAAFWKFHAKPTSHRTFQPGRDIVTRSVSEEKVCGLPRFN